MLRGSYLCSAPLMGQRAGLLLLPGRLHKSFRHGGGRGSLRPSRFVSAPAPGGAGGHGSRTRVSLRRPSVSTGPGRAPGRRQDAGGEEGWGEKERGENGAGAGSKLRPSPAERRERPSPAGSARGRRPRPKRDCNVSRLPSPPGPPAPGPGPRPPVRPLAARKFPREAAGTNRHTHLAPPRSLARSLPCRERRVRVWVRVPAPPPPPRGCWGSRGSARSAPAAPPHVRAWPGKRGGNAGGERAGALLCSGTGGAPAAEIASRPPRAAPFPGALWDRSSSTA